MKGTRTTRKCAYCCGPHPVSDRVAEENPFCASCLHERVGARAALIERGTLFGDGAGGAVTPSQREKLDSTLS
jgi:hypothetical protein